MKTLMGFRNMKQIDFEISKINIALSILQSDVNDIASATVSKPSLSDIHSKRKHQDSIFVNFVDDIKKIRDNQAFLKKRLEFIKSIKKAIINYINLDSDSELSKIFKAYFIDNIKIKKIADDMSLSVPLVYKRIGNFYDFINNTTLLKSQTKYI